MSQGPDLRQRIETELRDGQSGLARQHLAQLWQREPTMAVASYVLGCRSRLKDALAFTPFKLAIVRSFTVEPIVTLLRAGALVDGVDVDVQVGDFNAYAQELLDPTSGVYRFRPDAVLLAVLGRDLGLAAVGKGRSELAADRIVEDFRGYLGAFRSRSDASLVIQGLEETSPAGEADPASAAVNERLRELAEQQPGVYFLDYQALAVRHGVTTWNDERNWAVSRLPLANASLVPLARAWLRFVYPLAGKLSKVLVTDLDNTLWSGVIGEDGLAGIQCAASGPGEPHRALQQAMLEIRDRGVLLAVCSQNNPAEALEALEQHPGLLLRPQHFAAVRINWESKVSNLREIARELDLGSDALAYLDDDAAQLERVRTELPEVHVIGLPVEKQRYGDNLRDDPVFARLRLSREDLERSRYYAEQRSRQQLQQRVASLEDFYRSLEQEVTIAPMTPETTERAAQLTQKTNQFNLTTRRYSARQLGELALRPGWQVFTLRVTDRFGDSGLTGLAITHEQTGRCEIDTLLLSCRIIGRTVETALLSFLLERARRLGLREVVGAFVPTHRNGIAADLLARHGFEPSGEREGASLWAADPARNPVECPSWIRLTVEAGALV